MKKYLLIGSIFLINTLLSVANSSDEVCGFIHNVYSITSNYKTNTGKLTTDITYRHTQKRGKLSIAFSSSQDDYFGDARMMEWHDRYRERPICFKAQKIDNNHYELNDSPIQFLPIKSLYASHCEIFIDKIRSSYHSGHVYRGGFQEWYAGDLFIKILPERLDSMPVFVNVEYSKRNGVWYSPRPDLLPVPFFSDSYYRIPMGTQFGLPKKFTIYVETILGTRYYLTKLNENFEVLDTLEKGLNNFELPINRIPHTGEQDWGSKYNPNDCK